MKEGRAIAEGQEVNTGCVSCAIQCICMCQVSAVTVLPSPKWFGPSNQIKPNNLKWGHFPVGQKKKKF